MRLIILDLNGFLVHRVHKRDAKNLDRTLLDTAESASPFFIWCRPHAAEFLQFLFLNFTVAIWTSARDHNAETMLNALLKDTGLEKDDFLFVWGQDKCECERATKSNHQKKKYLFKKPLARVWEAFPEFDERNTLLIDDSVEKTVDNPPGLHYCPLTWSVLEHPLDQELAVKDGKLTTWLRALHQFQGPVAEFVLK